MKSWVIFSSLVLNFYPLIASAGEVVINGHDLQAGELPPSIVKIETSDGSYASGIIIGHNTVLIAGHTAPLLKKEPSFQVSITSEDNPKVKRKFPVKIVTHYKESLFPTNRDRAAAWEMGVLIFPDQTFKNELIAPLSIEKLNPDDSLQLLGYGSTDLDDELSPDRPQVGSAKLAGVQSKRNQGVFLVEDKTHEAMAAAGDSGGGIFKNKKLVGIITHHDTNAREHQTVDTRFSVFREPLALSMWERAKSEGATGLDSLIDYGKSSVVDEKDPRKELFGINEELLAASSKQFSAVCNKNPKLTDIENAVSAAEKKSLNK
jgi:hypothetical protein